MVTSLTSSAVLRIILAAGVAKLFVNKWMFSYRPPKELVCNSDKLFPAKFIQDVCQIFKITFYYVQAGEQVEPYNRAHKVAIRSYLKDNQNASDLYMPTLAYAYDCISHTATASAPSEPFLPRPPLPLATNVAYPRTFACTQEGKLPWEQSVEKSISSANSAFGKTQQCYKRHYDARLQNTKELLATSNNVF